MPGSLWSCMTLRYGRAPRSGCRSCTSCPPRCRAPWTCCEPTAPITLDVKPAAVAAAEIAPLMAVAIESLVAPTP